MFQTLKDKVKAMWNGMWDWVHNSGTILLGRIETVIGLIITGIGAADFAPLWSLFGTGTAFTWREVTTLGGILTARGVIGEVIRRRNTVVKNDQLVPVPLKK